MDAAGKLTVLIIDDELGFRRTYRTLLMTEGYDVLEAYDGELGWALAKDKKPDIILMDLVLPKLQGLELLKMIRSDPGLKDTPVIALAAMGNQKEGQKGLEAGANDYAMKGFTSPREILNKIHAVKARVAIKNSINSDFLSLADITTYEIFMKNSAGDAAKLMEAGLPKGFICSKCRAELALEMFPNHSRSDGQWFFAHFVCPKCKAVF